MKKSRPALRRAERRLRSKRADLFGRRRLRAGRRAPEARIIRSQRGAAFDSTESVS